jgi:ankyrin repeat protein
MPQARSLDRITIPNPCDADWDSMSGNDQVRFCEHCNLHVTDLSSLSRSGAMRLVAESQGRLCVRFIQRPGGGVLTRAPEKLYRIGRRASRLAAGVFTATLSVSSAMAQTRPSSVAQSHDSAELVLTTEDLHGVADEFAASIAGTIKTEAGALVSEATVVLVDRETGEERNTTSSPAGEYVFQFLPAGDYLLWVRKPEFETSRNTLRVNANSTLRQDIELSGRRRISVMGGMAMIMFEENPLLKAVTADDIEQVRVLAFSESNINQSSRSSGNSVLAEAVERGNREIMAVLISAGADVNTRSDAGRTALMSLSEKASPELVRDLVFAGAKLNARDDAGNSALMNASSSSSASVLSELIKIGAQVDATNSSGETALFAAARANSAEAIELLIKAGANVNARDEDGQTALMAIASSGDFEKARALIAHGAEIDLKDNDGQTLLMLAAMNEDPRLAKLLLEAGAKMDATDREGTTALMMAAERGPETTALLLIQAGAQVNAVDKEGRSVLMRAVFNGQEENVRALLNAGADYKAKDKEGNTVLALARENGNEEVLKLLKSRGAPE